MATYKTVMRSLDLVSTIVTARPCYNVQLDIEKQEEILVGHIITMNYTIPVPMHDTIL